MVMNEKILIIKHGALGDVIQGFDAFASIRAHFSDAHIAVLTSGLLHHYYRRQAGLTRF